MNLCRCLFTCVLLPFALVLALPGAPAHAQSETNIEGYGDIITGEESRRRDVRDTENDAANDAIDMGADILGWGRETYEDANDFMDDWQSLDRDEQNCGSGFSDAGAPTVPSSCAEGGACYQCYESAVRKIDFNRFYIERARCITEVNVRMANSAMAFGDTSSGIHAVTGLAWQLEGKPPIKKATEDLKRTYTRKAGQYLQNLEGALQELGQCEAEHFGERDWYQRYGWIYLNFMKAKYASAPE